MYPPGTWQDGLPDQRASGGEKQDSERDTSRGLSTLSCSIGRRISKEQGHGVGRTRNRSCRKSSQPAGRWSHLKCGNVTSNSRSWSDRIIPRLIRRTNMTPDVRGLVTKHKSPVSEKDVVSINKIFDLHQEATSSIDLPVLCTVSLRQARTPVLELARSSPHCKACGNRSHRRQYQGSLNTVTSDATSLDMVAAPDATLSKRPVPWTCRWYTAMIRPHPTTLRRAPVTRRQVLLTACISRICTGPSRHSCTMASTTGRTTTQL
jgi:hypothetical protein